MLPLGAASTAPPPAAPGLPPARTNAFISMEHSNITSKLIVTHHIIRIQKREAISASGLGYLFNKQLATSFDGCRSIMCSRKRDHARFIMASKLKRI
jgi:hypothetical protein